MRQQASETVAHRLEICGKRTMNFTSPRIVTPLRCHDVRCWARLAPHLRRARRRADPARRSTLSI
jgi:hypothetical protein